MILFKAEMRGQQSGPLPRPTASSEFPVWPSLINLQPSLLYEIEVGDGEGHKLDFPISW